ncbi:uncharacterized protein METZ01_LOCUS172005, partial [marine metagenome]
SGQQYLELKAAGLQVSLDQRHYTRHRILQGFTELVMPRIWDDHPLPPEHGVLILTSADKTGQTTVEFSRAEENPLCFQEFLQSWVELSAKIQMNGVFHKWVFEMTGPNYIKAIARRLSGVDRLSNSAYDLV